MSNQGSNNSLHRTVDWKQGLSIAIGVPLLILPSIGYFASYVWSFSIIIWLLSVIQGFFQNIAYGELATMFPDASGLPGYAQKVFQSDNQENGFSSFIGGFSAWSYWFAWSPVMAIFSLLIGSYLKELIMAFNNAPEIVIAAISGIVIFVILFIVNYKGLENGALLSYVLAALSIVPILIITLVSVIKGDFNFSNILIHWIPTDFTFDIKHILIIIGLFAMAQWSACAWETAAVYGPEYKNPRKDIIKSLFVCGAICLFTFAGIQAVCIGVIGIDDIIARPYLPILVVAEKIFGSMGVNLSILALVASMVLIIQTAFLGSARAMHSMAVEGNLPKIFGKTNQHGVPVFAMGLIIVFNLLLIGLKTPASILAASSIGYVFANGISLFAYVKTKFDKKFDSYERVFKAPDIWKYIAAIFAIINIPVFLVGIIYLNSIDLGWKSTILGFAVLGLYIPLWIATQNRKGAMNNKQ